MTNASKTRLDSHAVAPVVGCNASIIRSTGQTTDVFGFTKALSSLQSVPIVDAAIAYDCPYTFKTFVLVIYNAMYIEDNEDNLIPPFLLREAGLHVNERAKIHTKNPTIEDHSIYFPEQEFRIPLQLSGIVSYFPSRSLVQDDFGSDLVCDLTPDTEEWNPNDSAYALREMNMLDSQGQIVDQQTAEDLNRDILDINDSDDMQQPNSSDEPVSIAALIDKVHDMSLSVGATALYDNAIADEGNCADENLLDFARRLNEKAFEGKYAMSVGAVKSEVDAIIGAASRTKPNGITPERLAKVFRIDEATAKQTLQVTTQAIRRTENPTLERQFTTNDRKLRYRRIKDHFFMDTFFVSKKLGVSRRGFSCMQLFVTDKGFVFVVGMRSKSQVPQACKLFFKKVGLPDTIICDGSKEQTQGETKKMCDSYGTTIRRLEKNTPWANRAELYIGLLKRGIKDDLKRSNAPLILWDYCAERRAQVNNVTAKNLFQLEGQTPTYHTLGHEPDISNICRFEWYEWVYFREEDEPFPVPNPILGRALGPSINNGNEMAQWILRIDGTILPRRTVRSLTTDEMNCPIRAKQREAFDLAIQKRLGTTAKPPVSAPPEQPNIIDTVDIDADETEAIDEPVQPSAVTDKLIQAEVQLPHNDEMVTGTVIGIATDSDGTAKGRESDHPLLDTQVYDVMFPDGTIKPYAANIIAENMYAQVDTDGHHNLLIDEIIDHKTDEKALTKENMYVTMPSGAKKMKKSCDGWYLQVQWKDGSASWIPLKDAKRTNPLQVAQYAQAKQIQSEPAFAWWVPYVLKKRDVIISAVNQRVQKSTHKFGIKVPRTVKEALEFDRENGNDLWKKAIDKEMANVSVAFDILEEGKDPPPGYSKATCHIIFDVKMDFTRKARFVKDGHKTADPEGSRFAGVVSRESVRIALTYAALNGLDVCAADIRNAYLQAKSSEKHYVECGLEFGLENIGKKAIITRALYGGKVSGRDFRNALRDCMRLLGFKSCLADPDVWMREAVKSDGSKYWEYVLLYVDDALCISENPEKILREGIGEYFALKEESIGPPDIYLGGKLSKVTLENGSEAWGFSPSQYVKAAIKNVEEYLEKEKIGKLPVRAKTPLSPNYQPELDTSNELSSEDAAYYQSLIGILRWMVELGRVDICVEVSMMSSHLALPRQNHLEELFHMFAYLKMNHNTEMVYDPSDPQVDSNLFKREDWSATEFGELTEELPTNRPEERGMGFIMTAFVDADHASDTVTRRSRTGFLVYLQSAPIFWYSKKQNGIETSSFGSEFMAMKQCTEYIRGLRYKLRMMGIACNEPAMIHADNKSVLVNVMVPDSQLKKKSNSIAYHFVREGCARDEWRMAYINTHDNLADLLTKALPAGEKRMNFVRRILYHIFGGGHDSKSG